MKAVMAAIPAAVVRYRELVANLRRKTPIDVEQAREGDPQHRRPQPGSLREDGVPVAELALNQQIALAAVGAVDKQIDLVAGPDLGLIFIRAE